jgi:hypothetical protein
MTSMKAAPPWRMAPFDQRHQLALSPEKPRAT